MVKKVIILVLSMFSFIVNTQCVSFKGGDVIDGVYVLKIKSNGEKEYKKGQFIVDEYGDYVYCLEPFIKVNNSSKYDEYSDNFAKTLGISDELWQKINLISYYGYKYKDSVHDHNEAKWYYITQMMIWQVVSPESRFYFTDSFKGNINATLFESEIKEINDLISNHFVIPEFKVPDAYIGDTLTIIDQNGVLSKFSSDDFVSIKGNILTIDIKKKENTFTLRKSTNNRAYIFVSSDSQNILKGKMDVLVKANYIIKGKPVLGKISLKKYGEIYNNGNYSKEVLEGVTFTLYDENRNILRDVVTNKDGEAVFGDLPEGKYYIKETGSIDGYVLDDREYEVILKLNKNNIMIDVFLEIENVLDKGKLVIKKIDFDNGFPLENTKFVIMKDDVIIHEGVTNKDGILEVKDLPFGKYLIKEIEAKSGYVLDEMVYEVKINGNNKDVLLEIKNELEKGKLVIKKVNASNNEAISNTEFVIIKDGIIIYKGVTNEYGILEVNNLVLGKYVVRETRASDGFILNEEEIDITLDKDINYIEISNIPDTDIQVNKLILYFDDKLKNKKVLV